MILAVVLLGLVSQGLAFQCDAVFTHRECGKFDKASATLASVVKTVDQVVAEAMIEMADESAKLYETMLPLLSKMNLEGKTIKVDDKTTIGISKGMTQEEYQKILNKMMSLLKGLKNIGLGGEFDLEELAKKIQASFTEAITIPVTQGYSLSPWEVAKEKVKKALKNVSTFTRWAILGIMDRYHYHLEEMAAKVDIFMNLLPIQTDAWVKLKTTIHSIIENLRNQITPSAVTKAETATKLAETDLVDMFDEMSQQKPIVKRAVRDVWAKVKAAVTALGGKIKDATMKVVQEYKPKVIESLENLKRIFIDGAKQIIFEINGAIVKVLTEGAVGTSN